MEISQKIIDICGGSKSLQKAWEPHKGDMVYILEQKMYENRYFHKMLYVTHVDNEGRAYTDKEGNTTYVPLLYAVGPEKSSVYVSYSPGHNIWIPHINQLIDLLLGMEDGWTINNHEDLRAFLEVVATFGEKKKINDFYELMLRFTLSECFDEE